MKKCPFCAEEILDEAIKCKHCREFLDGAESPTSKLKIPWYFSTSSIVISILMVGPLALPLIWLRPGLSKAWRIGSTIAVLILTYFLTIAMMESYRVLQEYYGLTKNLYK
ncbi:MAG: zinc ribbon domain-containing protein [Planctomycetota bacterium]|jgi:hypothetical protein